YSTRHAYIYTLSLHDALPICRLIRQDRRRIDFDPRQSGRQGQPIRTRVESRSQIDDSVNLGVTKKIENQFIENRGPHDTARTGRSEEHTSEFQSLTNLVCLLL